MYFTVAKGAVYGVSANYCFQNGNMTVRIPGCGVNDELILDFSGAGGESTVTSENITAGTLTLPASVKAQGEDSKVSTRVKENGDVVLEMEIIARVSVSMASRSFPLSPKSVISPISRLTLQPIPTPWSFPRAVYCLRV